MVRMAASLSVAGSFGALNLSIVDVQVPVQALCESVRPYPARPGHIGIPDAGLARKEPEAAQAYPVDIFSIIAEMSRSIEWLSERTASVSRVYNYYTPAGIGVSGPAYHWPTGKWETAGPDVAPGAPSGLREPPGVEGEKPREHQAPAAVHIVERSSSVSDLGHEVRQSSLTVEQLKGDLVGLTRDLAGIEAAMGEIVRLSLAGSVDVIPVPLVEASQGMPVPDTPAAEATYAGPRLPGPAGKEGFPAEQPEAGRAKPAPVPEPTEFARSVARSAGLSKALWGSSIEAVSIPETVTRGVMSDVVAGATAVGSLPQADEYLQPGPGTLAVPGRGPTPAPPVYPAVPEMAQVSPVVQTIATYNTIINAVKASEALNSILPMRSVAKGEITQYLLAMPGQSAGDRQIKAMNDIGATLLANARPMVPAMGAVLPSGAGAPGDIPDLWLAVRSLQDSFVNLRGSVPGLADFIGLQRAVEAMPATSAVPAGEANTPRLSIAIEGVKTAGSSIELPDFTVVNGQFRQMQTMMARMQVPMYAEGGTVTEPTLAFVAEAGPESIVSGRDFAEQITTLNSNYQGLWDDVLVLRDGVKEMVGGVNEVLSSATSGEDDTDDLFQRLYTRFWEHFHISSDDLVNLFSFSSFRKFFNTGVEMVGEYEYNVMEEALIPDEVGGGEKGSGGGGAAEANEIEDMDKEEEEFWDLLDKVDQINTILKKRKGKFDDD